MGKSYPHRRLLPLLSMIYSDCCTTLTGYWQQKKHLKIVITYINMIDLCVGGQFHKVRERLRRKLHLAGVRTAASIFITI